MFKSTIFSGRDLILEHAQPDYMRVLRFTMQSLAELVNNNARDYRITIIDTDGNMRFFAIGEMTEVINEAKQR